MVNKMDVRKEIDILAEYVTPTGGCLKCARCDSVGWGYYCGRTRLTNKQLYNAKGYCSKFISRDGEQNG